MGQTKISSTSAAGLNQAPGIGDQLGVRGATSPIDLVTHLMALSGNPLHWERLLGECPAGLDKHSGERNGGRWNGPLMSLSTKSRFVQEF